MYVLVKLGNTGSIFCIFHKGRSIFFSHVSFLVWDFHLHISKALRTKYIAQFLAEKFKPNYSFPEDYFNFAYFSYLYNCEECQLHRL